MNCSSEHLTQHVFFPQLLHMDLVMFLPLLPPRVPGVVVPGPGVQAVADGEDLAIPLRQDGVLTLTWPRACSQVLVTRC